MKNEKAIEDLKWVRVFTALHVPRYLVEQVRDRDFSVEDFYTYQDSICFMQSENGPKLNPFSHLYVLVDQENLVKGFLWFVVDPLTKDLIIQTFSVDKEYWFKGKAVSKLAKHIKDIRKKASLNKVYWLTNYPKHSMRYGFRRSKAVLMEYNEEEENGKDTTRRDSEREGHQSADSSTAELSQRIAG